MVAVVGEGGLEGGVTEVDVLVRVFSEEVLVVYGLVGSLVRILVGVLA